MAPRKVPHLLKKNKKKQLPRHWILFDTETYEQPQPDGTIEMPFRLGWAVYWRLPDEKTSEQENWHQISSPADFWDFVESHTHQKETLYLVAHNIRFDLVTLAWEKELLSRQWTLVSFYESQQTQIYRFQKEKKHLIAISSTNLFPGKLASWGKVIDLPKLEVDFDKDSEEYISTYCRRDVEILLALFRWWTSFIQDENLGNFQITIASQAFSTYRHKFMQHKIHVHANEKAISLERDAYAGGRSQPLRVGIMPKQQYYKLDVNSMYPFVMKRNEFPTELVGYHEEVDLETLYYWLEKYALIIDAEISINEPVIAIHRDGRIIFPVGTFRAQICTPEIEYVIKHGSINKVYRAAAYRKAHIFDQYVNYWYNLKVKYTQEKDPLRRKVTKLFLNSLYGKFGQLHHTTRVLGEYHDDMPPAMIIYDADTGQQSYAVALFGQYYAIEVDGEAFNSFVAVAAHVTAYARVYLWYSMKAAGIENVLYTDTDSMIVTATGFQRMKWKVDDLYLGGWKLEGTTKHLEIYAPKHYVFGDEIKLKGVPENAKETEPGVFEYYTWPGSTTLAKLHHLNQYMLKPTQKVLQENVTWGKLQPDGTVAPFSIPEDLAS